MYEKLLKLIADARAESVTLGASATPIAAGHHQPHHNLIKIIASLDAARQFVAEIGDFENRSEQDRLAKIADARKTLAEASTSKPAAK